MKLDFSDVGKKDSEAEDEDGIKYVVMCILVLFVLIYGIASICHGPADATTFPSGAGSLQEIEVWRQTLSLVF